MEYLVSVRLMTYNQAPCIAEAMDGILMQEVDFPVEVVVGDDFSDDGTLDIIRNYESTEKIHIKILERKKGDDYWKKRKEKGRLYNFINILENCTGKYIALLDGDDYWTDPLKLQKQVEFMQEQAECSIVFHACIWKEKVNEKTIKYSGKRIIGLNEYLLTNPFLATASLLFKRSVIDHYEPWMLNLFAGDIIIKHIAFLEGSMGYIDDVMCVYNKGVENSWSKRKLTKRVTLKQYKDSLKILRFLEKKFTGIGEGIKKQEIKFERRFYFDTARAISGLKGFCFLVKNFRSVGIKRIANYTKKMML